MARDLEANSADPDKKKTVKLAYFQSRDGSADCTVLIPDFCAAIAIVNNPYKWHTWQSQHTGICHSQYPFLHLVGEKQCAVNF